MKLLPVLEPLDKPKEGIWYSLMPVGDVPGVSVGHTCMFVPSADGGKGRILIVGGANPSGSFSHSIAIDLDKHQWDITQWDGLESRYEHCSFIPDSCPQSLWVFAGAQQTGNRNCIQNLQLTDGEPGWKNVAVTGEPPSPRTYHTNSACIGERLYVFCGGDAGTAPVSDSKLHVFDTASSTWSQPETQGSDPPTRQGHIIAAVGSKIYIHGGMAGDILHTDMHSLDTTSMLWEKVPTQGDIPPGLAGHSAVVLGKNIYIFGGMTAEGSGNSMYRFNTDTCKWVLLKFEGDLPHNRLDHSMCIIPWEVCAQGSEGEQQAGSPSAPETINLAFVFGGLDTLGAIHNDCVVTVVT
ncbi:uncharacterized protein V6R79_015984 [Siganus canaliculatus]